MTVYDTTPPSISSTAHEVEAQQVIFLFLAEDSLAGIESVSLWVQVNGQPEWLDTGLISTLNEGCIAYVPTEEITAYSLLAKDKAGNECRQSVVVDSGGEGEGEGEFCPIISRFQAPVLNTYPGLLQLEVGGASVERCDELAIVVAEEINAASWPYQYWVWVTKPMQLLSGPVVEFNLTQDGVDGKDKSARQVIVMLVSADAVVEVLTTDNQSKTPPSILEGTVYDTITIDRRLKARIVRETLPASGNSLGIVEIKFENYSPERDSGSQVAFFNLTNAAQAPYYHWRYLLKLYLLQLGDAINSEGILKVWSVQHPTDMTAGGFAVFVGGNLLLPNCGQTSEDECVGVSPITQESLPEVTGQELLVDFVDRR